MSGAWFMAERGNAIEQKRSSMGKADFIMMHSVISDGY